MFHVVWFKEHELDFVCNYKNCINATRRCVIFLTSFVLYFIIIKNLAETKQYWSYNIVLYNTNALFVSMENIV